MATRELAIEPAAVIVLDADRRPNCSGRTGTGDRTGRDSDHITRGDGDHEMRSPRGDRTGRATAIVRGEGMIVETDHPRGDHRDATTEKAIIAAMTTELAITETTTEARGSRGISMADRTSGMPNTTGITTATITVIGTTAFGFRRPS